MGDEFANCLHLLKGQSKKAGQELHRSHDVLLGGQQRGTSFDFGQLVRECDDILVLKLKLV